MARTPSIKSNPPQARRLYVYLLVVWALLALAVGLPWMAFTNYHALIDLVLAAFFPLFAGVFGGLLLAIRTYALARSSHFLLIQICAGLAAWIAVAVCGFYTLELIYFINEYMYFNFG